MLLGYNFGKEIKIFKIILDFIVVIYILIGSKSHIMEVSHTTLQTKPSDSSSTSYYIVGHCFYPLLYLYQ